MIPIPASRLIKEEPTEASLKLLEELAPQLKTAKEKEYVYVVVFKTQATTPEDIHSNARNYYKLLLAKNYEVRFVEVEPERVRYGEVRRPEAPLYEARIYIE